MANFFRKLRCTFCTLQQHLNEPSPPSDRRNQFNQFPFIRRFTLLKCRRHREQMCNRKFIELRWRSQIAIREEPVRVGFRQLNRRPKFSAITKFLTNLNQTLN